MDSFAHIKTVYNDITQRNIEYLLTIYDDSEILHDLIDSLFIRCRGSSYSPGRVMVIPRGYIICYSTVSKSRQAACSATATFRMPSLR
jgi:hypothetical protein